MEEKEYALCLGRYSTKNLTQQSMEVPSDGFV
jgi:hypothetical protein